MMSNISLLGCGTWGSAISQTLAENGHLVFAWHYDSDSLNLMSTSRKHPKINNFYFHENITFEKNIERCISKSNLVVVAVPSHAVRELMNDSYKYYTGKTILINLSKGLENNTLKTMSEVILEVSGIDKKKIVSLYGPSHAEEVLKGFPTTLVSASIDNKTSILIQDVFSSDVLRIYTNNDLKGVELGGSLKNVIAIATGICDGIGFGDNTKAALLTRGMAEITRLGTSMGAKESTFSGLSGIGDLIATCLSEHSRNRHVGEEIGKGKSLSKILDDMDMVAEGVKTTRSVFDLSKKYNLDMPISEGVYKILFDNENPKSIVSELMNRDLVDESKK